MRSSYRSKFTSLDTYRYPHLVSLRFWNSYCRDEGVRAICHFLQSGKPVQLLELLHNKITPLGCEFISKTLHPKMQPQIQILKLDHNDFGSEGMTRLADGLAINPVLKMLSITYCGIDQNAAQAIFEILIYTKSALEELNLTGNVLRDEGVMKVLQGVSIAKVLKKIYLADNQFNCDDDRVLNVIEGCMTKNQNLGRYDFRYNTVSTIGKHYLHLSCLAILRLTDILKKAEHVFEINIPERIDDKEAFKAFIEQMGSNKPRKGKKGKGGGKKKKKKK